LGKKEENSKKKISKIPEISCSIKEVLNFLFKVASTKYLRG
jgi:hypothetical protein